MTSESDSSRITDPPLWVRRPNAPHVVAYALAAAIALVQSGMVVVQGSGWTTALAVAVAGAGLILSWWWPWPGLVLTSGAALAVTVAGRDPLGVWMIAVLVLFSFALRGRPAVAGTVVVAAFLVGTFMTVGEFRGGAVVGAAALFSAVAGGATGAALRLSRDLWTASEEQRRTAALARETEADRRVVEERIRIARDLHDVLGHEVALLSVHLGVAEVALPDEADSSRRALEAARNCARRVVRETQQTLVLLRRGDHDHRAEGLRPTPSVSGLAELLGSFDTIGLAVRVTGGLDPEHVSPGVGVTVYRVLQEALTNAHRHGAGSAEVQLSEVSGTVHLVVENAVGSRRPAGGGGTGPGAGTGTETGTGLGLVGMRERVEASGGRLHIERAGGFFRVWADLDAHSTAGSVVA